MAKAPKAKKKPSGPTLIQRSRRVSAASKALWNHGPKSGGSKRVYRRFFGLSQPEIDQISRFVGARIKVNLGG